MLHPDFLARPIAHRALHDVNAGRPENSRAAIEAAIRAGYGIEIDIQRSSDGVAMVFHDYTLDRLADATGPIATRTAAELGQLRLKGNDEGIPTLSEVLELVDGQVPLLIEVKDQDGQMGPNVGPLETAIAADLAGYGGPVALMSFNPNSVAALAELLPETARGLTTSSWRAEHWPHIPARVLDALRPLEDYDRVGACFVSHEHTDLRSDRITALKQKGARVLCWTIKSPEEEAVARDIAENVTFEGYLA